MAKNSSSTTEREEDLEDPFTNFSIRVPENYTTVFNFDDLFPDQETTVSSKELKALKTEVKVLTKKSVNLQSELDRYKIQNATMEASIKTLQNKLAVFEKNNSPSVQNQIDKLVQSVKELRELQGALQSQNSTVIDCIKQTHAVNRGGGNDQFKLKAESRSTVRCGSFACPECNIKFPTKGNLNMHMVRHNKKPSPFPCKVCSKSFVYIRELYKHLAEHKSLEAYHLCEYCGKRFGLERTLQLHMKAHHNSNKEGCQKEDRDEELITLEEDSDEVIKVISPQSNEIILDSQVYFVVGVTDSKDVKIVNSDK
ncbi:unnamed protein product [Orchesella dallaii]|uniref:C2H2-type domain-containing protein n=1 Tax=Orchesella dallaii TaxID=48710 RepID=A0ABP1Q2D0_9HEXA